MPSNPTVARRTSSAPDGTPSDGTPAELGSGRWPEGSGSRGQPVRGAIRRRERQREIVEATRALFDARENARREHRRHRARRRRQPRHHLPPLRQQGRALRAHLAEYLEELEGLLAATDDPQRTPPERLTAIAEVYVDFCLRYPAFIDCALALLRQPGSTCWPRSARTPCSGSAGSW